MTRAALLALALASCTIDGPPGFATCAQAPPQGWFGQRGLVCHQGREPRCAPGTVPACVDLSVPGGDIPNDAGPPDHGTPGCYDLRLQYQGPAHCERTDT